MSARKCMIAGFLCLLQPLAAAHAQGPGRLFFTPEQRRQLEQPPEPRPAPAPAEDRIRFDGMVWRGTHVVSLWINRNVVQAHGRYEPDPVSGRLQLTTQDGKRVSLGAGQHWPPSAAAKSVPEPHNARTTQQ